MGMRITSVHQQSGMEEPVATVTMTLPMGVLDIFSDALEYAARITGNEKLPVRIRAISEECLGEWQRQHEERVRAMVAGVSAWGLEIR